MSTQTLYNCMLGDILPVCITYSIKFEKCYYFIPQFQLHFRDQGVGTVSVQITRVATHAHTHMTHQHAGKNNKKTPIRVKTARL